MKIKELKAVSSYFLSTLPKKEGKSLGSSFFFVIRLGLEPRTPTLKVLCSTC